MPGSEISTLIYAYRIADTGCLVMSEIYPARSGFELRHGDSRILLEPGFMVSRHPSGKILLLNRGGVEEREWDTWWSAPDILRAMFKGINARETTVTIGYEIGGGLQVNGYLFGDAFRWRPGDPHPPQACGSVPTMTNAEWILNQSYAAHLHQSTLAAIAAENQRREQELVLLRRMRDEAMAQFMPAQPQRQNRNPNPKPPPRNKDWEWEND